MGHFALTGFLIDLIKETPNSRIVNVSSTAHKIGKLNFEDLNWETRRYYKMRSYGDSKLANRYFTSELQKRLTKQSSGVVVASAHPGGELVHFHRGYKPTGPEHGQVIPKSQCTSDEIHM